MSKAAIIQFQPNDVILAQGAENRDLYKIISGDAALFVNHNKPGQCQVGMLGALNYFGETSAFTGQPNSYTVVARSRVIVLKMPGDTLEGFLKNDSKTGMNLLQGMAQSLSMMYTLLDEISADRSKDALPALRRLLENTKTSAAGQPHTPARQTVASEIHGDGTELLPTDPEELPEPPHPDSSLFPQGHGEYPRVTHPEYREYLMVREYTCPHCKGTFQGWRVFYSNPRLVAVENHEAAYYDMRVFYRDFEPEWYEVVTCPHCYFSTLNTFMNALGDPRKSHYEEKLLQSRGVIWLDFDAELDVNFVFAQHYLALICATGFRNHLQITASLWSSLSWLYRSVHDDGMTRYAQKKAAEAYQQVYSKCDLSFSQRQEVGLRVAGLLYRAGDLQEARQWAFNVRMVRDGKPAYARLGEQLLADIRAAIELEQMK